MRNPIRHLVISTLTAFFFCCTAAQAAPATPAYNDAAALKGVTQGKGIFMISLDHPQKMALYLKVIGGTYDNFQNQGVKPDLKVVFIGASVRHLTQSSQTQSDAASRETYAELARQVEQLKIKGVHLEVCAIATALFGINNADLLKQLDVVNDGFISTIGYQTQGYQLVPIY